MNTSECVFNTADGRGSSGEHFIPNSNTSLLISSSVVISNVESFFIYRSFFSKVTKE